jgi:hypothetical protein
VGGAEFTSCVPRSLFQAAEGLDMRCVRDQCSDAALRSRCVPRCGSEELIKRHVVKKGTISLPLRSSSSVFKKSLLRVWNGSAAQMKNVNAT